MYKNLFTMIYSHEMDTFQQTLLIPWQISSAVSTKAPASVGIAAGIVASMN